MQFSVKFDGGKELAANLNKLSHRLSRGIQRDALIEGAQPIRKAASLYAPRAPGFPDLAENIGISPVRGNVDAVAVAIGPTKRFFYGLFQEFGTTAHGAQAFMRPAFDAEARGSLPIISAALWRELAGRGVIRVVESNDPIQSDGPLL